MNGATASTKAELAPLQSPSQTSPLTPTGKELSLATLLTSARLKPYGPGR